MMIHITTQQIVKGRNDIENNYLEVKARTRKGKNAVESCNVMHYL